LPPSITETTEFVVPRSIPTAFAITDSSSYEAPAYRERRIPTELSADLFPSRISSEEAFAISYQRLRSVVELMYCGLRPLVGSAIDT
jgi:hypothetical protein